MSFASLFDDLHGTINPNDLQPLSNNPYIDIDAVVGYLGVDENNLWENEKGIINRYFYWDGLYLFPFMTIEPEQLQIIYGSRENPRNSIFIGDALKFNGKKFADVKDREDYVTLLGMIDKKVLFHVYNSLYYEMPDTQKWEAYKRAHITAENGFDMIKPEIHNDLLTVQAYKSPEREARLKQLHKKVKGVETIQLYHGHNEEWNPKDEICWTLSYKTAKFFAHRFENEGGVVSSKFVNINDVLDYFPDRNEEEIILKPAKIF